MVAPSEPVLAATGLWKRYRRRGPWVLHDVSLEVPRGSITAIVGPNGAGKSTLIRTWMSFERPSRGQVSVDGIDPWRHRPKALRRIGYVPQAASLYRDLSVRDHLDLARVLRHDFDAGVARRHLIALGIPARQRAGDLSGGQQAQLGLALALATQAPVLLLDEPLASLDPLARRDFLRILTETVKGDGRTAFLSSHIVTDVEEACDRLIVISDGRIRLDGGVADARSQHWIVEAAGRQDLDLIGAFPGPGGKELALARAEAAPVAGSSATLEEIVLGYLAAGKVTEAADLGWAA
jgi:ABC-2 type transport system ATP-binding protein